MNTLNHRDRNEIGVLLDTKVYEKVEGKDLNDSNFIMTVLFLAGMCVFMASLAPYSILPAYSDSKWEFNIIRGIYYSLVIISSGLFAEAFLKLLRSKILSVFFSQDFISFFMRKRHLKVRFIFTIVFFTGLIYLVFNYIYVDYIETDLKDFLSSISVLCSVAQICFLISEIIVDYCDYISYSMNYRARVKENKRRLRLILKLNRLIPGKIHNLKTYANQLYQRMLELTRNIKSKSITELTQHEELGINESKIEPTSKEIKKLQVKTDFGRRYDFMEGNELDDVIDEQNAKRGIHKIMRRINKGKENDSVNEKFKPKNAKGMKSYLRPQDFENIFHSTEMFDLFDFDKDNKVTKPEFIKRYLYLFEEREKLKKALEINAINMFKIQILISSLFIPFIIFILLAMTGQLTSISESFTIAGLVVFPFSFAFQSVINELFESVIFVFFMKPFDIGDIFFTGFNDTSERYEVVCIGILYSDFFLNGRFVTLKNTSFNKHRIFNLRKSEFVTQIYKLQFNAKLFLSHEKELVEKLDDHFSDLPTSSYKLYNYQINNDKIRVILETKRVIPYQEVDTIEERHDSFIIYLNELLKEIGIE